MVLLQKLVPSQKIDAELVVRNSCGELGEMSMSNQAVRKVVLLFPNEQCRQYPKRRCRLMRLVGLYSTLVLY